MEDVMESTFAMSRIKIEKEVMAVETILTEFPYLKDPQQVFTTNNLIKMIYADYRRTGIDNWEGF